MSSQEWANKSIAVLGYGVEGRSSVNYFLKHEAKVTVHEQQALSHLPQEKINLHQSQGVRFLNETDAFKNLDAYDLVIRTPTFSPMNPALKNIEAKKISSQTQLFLSKWHEQSVGISGTKGKGTTASLLHHIIQKSDRKVLLGGNIGVPLLDLIDEMTPEHIAVLELSSYQLWDTTVSPHIAILLMIAPEHLELHGTLDNYLAAKQNLVRYQKPEDKVIVLSDYTITKHLVNLMPAQHLHIKHGWVESGASLDEEVAQIIAHQSFSVSLNQTKLKGKHNLENLSAAAVAASILDIDSKQIIDSLASYEPLPHRLQLVGKSDFISFYDDSIATTPEAAIAGIRSFNQSQVVILGGINKQANWDNLAKDITKSKIAGFILVGEEAPRIRRAIDREFQNVPILFQPDSYREALIWATRILPLHQEGVVLLSPGAKSFDQYQDYIDRGLKFTSAVNEFLDQQSRQISD